MKIVRVSSSKINGTEADLPEGFLDGCYVQLFHTADGYSARLVTPTMAMWIVKSVKRITTVNNRLAMYRLRFEVMD